VEDYKVLEALRAKERDCFFNIGEVKYVSVDTTLFSVKALKCYIILDGIDNSKGKENQFGKLLPETQISLKLPPQSFISM
jgi:hypothetical protein